MTKDNAIDCIVRLNTAIEALRAAYDIARAIYDENGHDADAYFVMTDIGDADADLKNCRTLLQGIINADR